MADNVNVPISGTGDTGPVKVATDDCGSGGHVGLGKLCISADGDRTFIPADAANGLDVDVTRVSGTVTVANGGTFATQAAQSGTWNITNISGTITLPTGAATAAKQPALGTAGTASADVITVQGVASMTPILATLSGTNNIATVTTVSTITNVVHVDDNSGSLTVDAPVGTPVFVRLSDGTNPITTLPVSLASVPSHAVTNAGTFATQSACAGDVAHDAADSGNPVKAGGRALLSARTAVSDGDRTDVATDAQGRVIVERDGPRDLDVIASITITSSTAETDLLAAVASTFQDIIDVVVANKSATGTLVSFKDSAAGTTRFVLYVPAGATVGFSGQRWPQATVNNKWTATCGTSVDSVYISVRARKTK